MEEQIKENDEISLLDLFLVLLKKRKLIIITICIAIVGTLTSYFVLPDILYNKKEQQKNVIISAEITPAKTVIEILNSGNTQYSIQSILQKLISVGKNPILVLNTLVDSGIDRLNGYKISKNDSDSSYIVNLKLIQNKNLDGNNLSEGSRIYNLGVGSSPYNLLISYATKDKEKGIAFVNRMISEMEASLYAETVDYSKEYVRYYKEIDFSSSKEDMSKVLEIQKNISIANSFIDGSNTSVIQEAVPIWVSSKVISKDTIKHDVLKKGIIYSIILVLLSIFLAFMLNAIDNIKQDSEAMDKVRRALGKIRK